MKIKLNFEVFLKKNVVNKILAFFASVNHLKIDFKGSYPSVSKAPEPTVPEFAFIGRSNVGKSSLINMLADRKSLAKTSSTPGKTQLINFFDVQQEWFLVDLPGYGYARLSKKHRESLRKMIRNYLFHRESLSCAMVLLDAKIPIQKIDEEMIDWLAMNGIPQAWVFTKVDKGKTRETNKQLKQNINYLSKKWESLPPYFVTSSEKRQGRKELLQFIQDSVAK